MAKPFGIGSDLHLHGWSAFATILPSGINSRLANILDALEQACAGVVAAGGERLYLAGDLFHVRGSIAPSVLNPVIDAFVSLQEKYGVTFRVIPGNHDLESRESRRLTNACQALERVGCTVCVEPTFFEDDSVWMVPWMPQLDDVRAALRQGRIEHNARVAIIHAPVNGVILGIPDHGLDAAELETYGYEQVFAGHYHDHKAVGRGVYSIGALTHQTWSDVDTHAGHVIVQPDGAIEHFESVTPRFVDFDLEWDEGRVEVECESNFVRVKLGASTESEIKTIREHILGLNAIGVIVQAQPQAAAVVRTGATVSSGASIGQSIADWIKAAGLGLDESVLHRNCMDVLGSINVKEAA